MNDRVRIFDTTLRDGEQSPGISFTPDDKVEIAAQLARLGVDIIEAGFPIASEGDFAAVQRVAREVQGPTIAGLARALPDDIDRAADAVQDAVSNRVHVFMATSPIHLEHKFQMTPEEVRTAVKSGVARARERVDDIVSSIRDLPDASRHFGKELQLLNLVSDVMRQAREVTTLEVRVKERTEEAAKLIEGHDKVDRIEVLEDDTIRATLKKDVEDYDDLAQALFESQFRVYLFREEEVNLETAFMELTKGMQQ